MITDLEMDICILRPLHIIPISACGSLLTILRAEPWNTYESLVEPAQSMDLIHVIACLKRQQRTLLSLIFLLAANRGNPLFQAAVAYEMFLALANHSLQRYTDEFFFQQEP